MLSSRTNMSKLYPPIEPFKTFFLEVKDKHQIYVELVGNPNGIPIVFLHGGPGSGIEPDHRRFFNPSKFFVILFDQRGCGKSTPYADIKNNTTGDLVSDMELLRQTLKIDKWHVFGGSWGSFLAISYAISYPQNVLSMILRGLFLGTKGEIDFFYQKGASLFFPEQFEQFTSILSFEEKNDIVFSFYNRLQSNDSDIRSEAALRWTLWEASCLKLHNTKQSISHFAKDFRIESLAKIETHYFINGCFVKDKPLLSQIEKIKHIPTTCVHGRYDLICPFENAYQYKKLAPLTKLQIAETSGHSGFEEEILNFLLHALDDIV